MKVNSPALDAYVRTSSIQPVGSPQSPPKVAGASDSSTSEAAQVTISAEAREKAAQANGIDEKKVAALKEKVQDGTYHVNPQILAVRLLEKLG